MTTLHIDPGVTAEEKERLANVGYGAEGERAGTCVVVNQDVRHIGVNDEKVEILPLKDALLRYDWVQDLMFGLVDPDANAHVREAAESRHAPVGHFVRIRAGAKVQLPVQLFTLLEMPQGRQFHHNVTLIEKDAEVEMISGSAVPKRVHSGHHISLSETYLREGAICRSVSIEQWGAGMEVHSYARSHVGKGARSTDSKVQMSPIKHHYAESRTIIEEGGMSSDQSVIFAPAGTQRIMESEIHLKGGGAHSESLTRMVSAGGSISNKALLVGEAKATKGFLGCNGLKLTEQGEILSVPSLLARSSEAQLSHEASIGMISQEKLAYLMSSGMSEDAARDLIIQGFLTLKDELLPEIVGEEVKKMIAAANSGSL
ncbi:MULTISPECIES: SufD family Fe-S cluster assembly protein [Sphingomonadaceae]|uniref:SufD family Fe-S cluster assembly protein n=1 Tax=Sphingomonadales TaxID=204457 RepID=UPI0007704352|nr:SufD family Fe-S cluster assembly protein [Sphingobium sp. TKS]AMK22947.1 SufBD protein [Sphingobium sp. TKS]MCF8706687.1 SufD family Fe-S cluster assembly protein [Rhizorhapis sp. SPR117]